MPKLFETILFSLLFVLPISGHAAPCPEGESVQKAIAARNSKVVDVYNTTMGATPEEGRNAIGTCLDSVSSLGDVFSMGVTIPGMDKILEGMCNQVNSMMQEKINEALNEVKRTTSELTGPFEITGTPSSISGNLINKIR